VPDEILTQFDRAEPGAANPTMSSGGTSFLDELPSYGAQAG
jgi:hypothetical protein